MLVELYLWSRGTNALSLDDLKNAVRTIGNKYIDREQRARRLFIEERAVSMHFEREREFAIRTEISEYFQISYSAVAFTGSAQLGFSIHQDRLFEPGVSDLDAACISADLFQHAWMDIVEITRSFTDFTPFGHSNRDAIELFKDRILRRGMIRIDAMPLSPMSRSWAAFEGAISRKHTSIFKNISIAVYMNEYAFCWKQDSALAKLIR
ncbi:MAG: hypothetical protein JWO15_1093 [Sphingomonadales bacterium]|nr:hypothetical protein [Sphingomonadales bacterium]